MNSRNVLLAVSAACFGLVGAALYLQHAMFMLPCPLCVVQRYLFLVIGFACLFGAFRPQPRIALGLSLAAALGGIGVAAKHLWVLGHPGLSCGIDPVETFLNKIPTATYMPWIFQADGLCENATDGLFGLSIPQWALVWFVILAATMLWMLVRGRRRA